MNRELDSREKLRRRVHGLRIRGMLDDTSWVKRRVEQISFIDDQTVRRRVSIDFKLPEDYANAAELRGTHWYVPFALFRKERPLVGFDLLDEEQRALPLATTRESRSVADWTLGEAAGSILKQGERKLSRELGERLKAVVRCAPADAERAVREAIDPHGGLDRYHLARDPLMERLVKDLSRYHLVLTLITEPCERRVVKFCFHEKVVIRDRGLTSLLGWKAPSFEVLTPGVSLSQNYHCELSAPENLDIRRAELFTRRGPGEPKGLSACTESVNEMEAGQTPGARIHLRLPEPKHGDETVADQEGVLDVELRASRPGLPGAAVMLALGVAILLTAGVVLHDRVAGHGESATALLVAVPALLSVYIARPEHQLAKRLLKGVSRLAAFVGVLALIAAASLLLTADSPGGTMQHPQPPRDDGVILMTWLPLAALAWLATVILSLSYFLPLAGRRSTPD